MALPSPPRPAATHPSPPVVSSCLLSSPMDGAAPRGAFPTLRGTAGLRRSPGPMCPSAQPAFASLVVLDVPIRLPGAHLGQAQIKLLDVRVIAQPGRRALQHDPPVLHDVAMIGNGQGQARVLLHKKNG